MLKGRALLVKARYVALEYETAVYSPFFLLTLVRFLLQSQATKIWSRYLPLYICHGESNKLYKGLVNGYGFLCAHLKMRDGLIWCATCQSLYITNSAKVLAIGRMHPAHLGRLLVAPFDSACPRDLSLLPLIHLVTNHCK